jgi:transcriptional regulator with XRE-family HTH domain
MDVKDPARAAQLDLAIGARLRTRRRQLGLSQSDLSERLGVSFQQVQKYERGANRVAASTLLAAAQALNVTIGWLVGEDITDREDNEDVFRALSKPGALEILEAFNRIADPRARTALLSLAREMGHEPSDPDSLPPSGAV